MGAIAEAYDDWADTLPQGRVYADETVEITKVRELAKVEKALGKADYRIDGKAVSTVAYQDSREFQISCLNRTLFIKAIDRLDEILTVVRPMGAYIQTVAVLAGDKQAGEIAARLCSLGADRIVEIGRMAVRKHGTPHDGTKGLDELVKWVSFARNDVEAGWDLGPLWQRYDVAKDTFDFFDDDERDILTLKRLCRVVGYAREHTPLLKSPLWGFGS